ncbi:hypothetical protein [Acidovorax sp.]|uniref:hypothetical protein n=1 Tax=Acidovorax sp. TaxID=1872122 RepID=UPI0025B87C45|nr:hypothetical protein [Acidovorax sp.]
MQVDQIAIALFGAFAAWLSQTRDEKTRRWACIFGLISQPFWFYATWQAEQWGMFALSALYALAWMKGLWVHWLGPKQAPHPIHGRQVSDVEQTTS